MTQRLLGCLSRSLPCFLLLAYFFAEAEEKSNGDDRKNRCEDDGDKQSCSSKRIRAVAKRPITALIAHLAGRASRALRVKSRIALQAVVGHAEQAIGRAQLAGA